MVMNISRRSQARASEEYLKLLEYVAELPHGAIIEYQFVEKDLKIHMDLSGKQKLRRAIINSGRAYSVIDTIGYQLAQADMSMGILARRLISIDNDVKRADQTQKVIRDSFYQELKPDEKKAVNFLGATFGAIRQAAESGKKLYSPDKKLLAQQNIVIPENSG